MSARRFFSLSLSLSESDTTETKPFASTTGRGAPSQTSLLIKEEEEETTSINSGGVVEQKKHTHRDDIDVFLSDAGKERSIIIIP